MRITVVQGDITVQDVGAVVNAANSTLMGGGGVDAAIHKAAGPELLDQCQQLRETSWPEGLPAGEAAITPAGKLPARYVIHTVGPNRHAGQTDPAVLEACFRNSLSLAAAYGLESVAFPAIGAGVYGWDAGDVARSASRVLEEGQEYQGLKELRFVLFDAKTAEIFQDVVGGLQP